MKNTLLFLAILSVCAMGLNLFGAKQSRQTPSKGKIVVFGGNGFVGSRVTRSLLDQGCSVVSISKSGSAPKWGNFEGASFVKGDPTNADDEKTIRTAARGAKAAISCIGTIGFDADRLTQGNGVANVEAVRIAKSAGCPKFVYVSVASSVQDAFGDALIKPYFKGKTSSNEAVTSTFGKNGVLVKPSFIYGGDKFELTPPRVPEGYGTFISNLLSSDIVRKIAAASPPALAVVLCPPVSVVAVADACAAAALGKISSSLIDGTDEINSAANAL